MTTGLQKGGTNNAEPYELADRCSWTIDLIRSQIPK
jgi:hypothetical protein